MRCDLCKKNIMKLKFKGSASTLNFKNFAQYAVYGDIYCCKSCGLVKQKTNLNTKRINELLKNEKYLNESIGQLALTEKHYQFNELTKILLKFTNIKNSSVLDIGANTGIFLDLIKDTAKSVKGIEPSYEAYLFCKKKGLNVKNGVIKDISLPTNTIEIATMWDVIEHLSSPIEDLKIINRWLKPKGLIFISTHNIESNFAKITGKSYPMLMYQHLYHFTPKTMSKILEKSGFRVKGIYPFKKSWSLGYLHALLKELWPSSFLSNTAHWLLGKLIQFKWISRIQVKVPINDFFVIVAEKV